MITRIQLMGVYSKCANSQIENTPVVIVSFGESRILYFERMQLMHDTQYLIRQISVQKIDMSFKVCL